MRLSGIVAFAVPGHFAAPLFAQSGPPVSPTAPDPAPAAQGTSPEPQAGPPPADTAPPKPAEPAEVRVIGDKADALQKIPGSGTLVTAKEIERAQPYDMAEMLRRVPGLNVRQEEGGGLRLDIGVRGLDPGRARRTLILEDGIPVAINPYAEADLYYVRSEERRGGKEW